MTAAVLNPSDEAAITRVLDSESTRFTDLLRAAGLSLETDLRFRSLRKIVLQPDEDVAGADFTGSDLSGAVLRRVDLSDVILEDAVLINADLRGAKLPPLTPMQLDQADTSPLPKFLEHGPNHLWPEDLRDDINDFLVAQTSDVTFHEKVRLTRNEGQFRLAEHLFRCHLGWRKVALEEDHRHILDTRYELAGAILNQGRAAEAEALLQALLFDDEKVQGSEASDTLAARYELARSVLDQGRAEDAEDLLQAVLPLIERVSGAEHTRTLTTRSALARSVFCQGRSAEAREMLAALVPTVERIDGTDHFNTRLGKRALAWAMVAERELEAAVELRQTLPANSIETDPRRIAQAELLDAALADVAGDKDAAEAHLETAKDAIAQLDARHYLHRELGQYAATRVPGKPGGNIFWMIDQDETAR